MRRKERTIYIPIRLRFASFRLNDKCSISFCDQSLYSLFPLYIVKFIIFGNFCINALCINNDGC